MTSPRAWVGPERKDWGQSCASPRKLCLGRAEGGAEPGCVQTEGAMRGWPGKEVRMSPTLGNVPVSLAAADAEGRWEQEKLETQPPTQSWSLQMWLPRQRVWQQLGDEGEGGNRRSEGNSAQVHTMLFKRR